jgi:hypothetical protein
MKHTLLSMAVVSVMGLTACSSTKTAKVDQGAPISAGAQQGITDQRLESNFKRQGVRVIYSVSGNLEAIEATGYAAVWGNSQNAAREAFRVAELEAKKSLNDFINKETIRSSTSVRMISRNLEKARDNKTNNFATNRGRDSVAAMTDDTDLVSEPGSGAGEVNREENVAVRNDALTIASRVSTTIVTQNQGILGGLYLVEGNVINDGKTVQVVYRWDAKHTNTRKQIRNMMAQ